MQAASIVKADADNYRELLSRLQPGDTLLLEPGVYKKGLPVHRLHGSEDKPIIIMGPSNGPLPSFPARLGHNTISIINASYIVVRNLALDGRGMAVDGVKCEGHADWAHHITLENLIIKGHGNNQQTVGISTKCPAWNWIIRSNTIFGAGTGMYLGNSDGNAPFVSGVIEKNLIMDTMGYNLQVKHQNARPEIPGMPQDPSFTIIRHNVFSKENGAATGPLARPNVLVGHWPVKGDGSKDTYEIYGNFFYQNPTESLFQGEGNIALYNNIFVSDHGDAIRIQPHNDIPRAIHIFYNTVVTPETGISVIPGQGSENYVQHVSANVIFASKPIIAKSQESNSIGKMEEAVEYLLKPFAPLGAMDLYPKVKSMKSQLVDTTAFRNFEDWDIDFNKRKRNEHVRGAYGGKSVNPGWLLQLERKP
ncbi:MAG: hypothetical protein ABIR84_12315 [Candidatus Nitrotoga sp.]